MASSSPPWGEAVGGAAAAIQAEATRLMADKAYLESVYTQGAQRAQALANRTLRKVYKKVGFVPAK